ncbi:MAG: Rrf2 family transcriptional regulator [Lysobacterales bacterium]
MKLTRFTDYALRVLIYLGLREEGRVTIREISESYDISRNHLMKVVSNLTRLGRVAEYLSWIIPCSSLPT